MNNYSVYKHITPNQKVYIGITSRNPQVRWRNGKGYESSPHFNNAIKQYGWENIKHEILFEGLTKEEACEKEKELIAQYNSTDRRFGYNGTYGGETGLKITPEVREKIASATRERYKDPVNRAIASQLSKGYKHTAAAKEKIRLAKLGTTHVKTPIWKQRISEGLRKTYNDPKNAAKYKELRTRLGQYGIAYSKAVIQFGQSGEIIAAYESVRAAERTTGIRNGNISKCCHGIVKHAGGYAWQFASYNIGGREIAIQNSQAAERTAISNA